MPTRGNSDTMMRQPGTGDPAERIGRPRAAADVVARLTRPLFRRRGLADGTIVRDWPLIVGDTLAHCSVPERIVFPGGARRDGILYLRVAGGSLAVELQHLEPLVLERINGYFGYRAVAALKLVQGPLPRRPATRAQTAAPRPLNDDRVGTLESDLARIAEPRLRHALARLGRAVAHRRRRATAPAGAGPADESPE